MKSLHAMPFGAATTEGGVRFAVWAPAAREAAVEVDDRSVPMARAAEGFFYCFDPDATPGSRYAFRFDTTPIAVPDPASRFNPQGVHDRSEVVDPTTFNWQDTTWRGRPWHEAVIYELHIGTFTREGTYAAAAARLDYLADLGVTAIELMPLATTPGRWNWGYDGVLPFAPHHGFGRPEDLKRFIDRAHERGLMVFLDVVYNHFGPEGNYLRLYAPDFFTTHHHTPWGNALNFDAASCAVVRQFFIHNALYWLEEYHFDGLRLDAVHTIVDDSNPTLLRELASSVHDSSSGRALHLVLENDHNDARLLERDSVGRPRAYTAQWNDDFHHALYVLLADETRGHYRDYDRPGPQLLRALLEGFTYQGEPSVYRSALRGTRSAHLPPEAFVNFLQNHDQIGNRPDAQRLWRLLEPKRMLAAETLLALLPTPILMFMGDEFHAPSPFPFFCDFPDELARAIADGRRRELASIWREDHRGGVPDPTSAAARAAAVLDWSALAREPHQHACERQRERLAVRRAWLLPRLPARPACGAMLAPRTLLARWTLADGATLRLSANLAAAPYSGASAPQATRLLATTETDAGPWPPWYVEWALEG